MMARRRRSTIRLRLGHVEVCMIPDLSPGNRFPNVDLPDHAGNERRLSELAGGGDPLMLNFYRGWW